jgi:hypothetical protein
MIIEQVIKFFCLSKRILFNSGDATKEELTLKLLLGYIFTLSIIPAVIGGLILSIPISYGMVGEMTTVTLGQFFVVFFSNIVPIFPFSIPRIIFDKIMFILSTSLNIPLFIIILFSLSLIRSFILTISIHFFGKFFRFFKKSILYTFRSSVYSETPSIFYGWIPLINSIATIQSVIIFLRALSNQQEISYKKGFLLLIVSGITIAILIYLILFSTLPIVLATLAKTESYESYQKLKEKALESKDISLCWWVDYRSRSDDCFSDFAREFKDVSICEYVLDNITRDSCYYSVALIVGNSSICDRIVNGRFSAMDRAECYYKIAEKLDDSSICNQIKEKQSDIQVQFLRSVKKMCFGVLTLNSSICEELEHTGSIDHPKYLSLRNECFGKIAEDKKDSSLCKKIPFYAENVIGEKTYYGGDIISCLNETYVETNICSGLMNFDISCKDSFSYCHSRVTGIISNCLGKVWEINEDNCTGKFFVGGFTPITNKIDILKPGGGITKGVHNFVLCIDKEEKDRKLINCEPNKLPNC